MRKRICLPENLSGIQATKCLRGALSDELYEILDDAEHYSSTERKDAKLVGSFDNIMMGSETQKFYKEAFGATASGATYVTNAFPLLYYFTLEEMLRRVSDKDIQDLSKKISSKKMKEMPPPTGAKALELNKRKYSQYSIFQRVCLEIKAASQRPIVPGRGFYTGEAVSPVKVRITPFAMRYGNTVFKKAKIGYAYILEHFPNWYSEEINSLSSALLESATGVFKGVALDSPMAAGSLLPVLWDKEQAEKLPVFTRACIEIYSAGPTFAWKETKARKVPGEKKLATSYERNVPGNQTAVFVKEYPGNYLVDAFGSRNRGMLFAIDSFPFLIEKTLSDEVEGVFSIDELALINNVMGEVIQPMGATAGMVLIPVIEKYLSMQPFMDEEGDRLMNKLRRLSVFARMCLETGVWR